MKLKIIYSLTFLLALLALSACGPAEALHELPDTQWELVAMPNYPDLGPVEVSLNIGADGSIGGSGGCNGFGGSYVSNAADSSIQFNEIFSTEMYCEDNDASVIEMAYFQALNEAQSYVQTFEELLIRYPGGTLEFLLAP